VPIYDYVCGVCRHRFEVFHGLNESGPHLCPLCGGRVSRAFAPPTIHFKGSGWAKMDRRSGGSPRRKPAEHSPEPDGGATDGGPAEGAAGSGSTTGPNAAG
jgi:putative FmdB family regulatory protein